MAEKDGNRKMTRQRDGRSSLLYVIYVLMLGATLLLVGRLVYIQLFMKPDPEISARLTAKSTPHVEKAERGNILACDGRMLAVTYPVYNVTLDCRVVHDSVWKKSTGELSAGLSRILRDRSAADYLKLLNNGRIRRNGNLHIASEINIATLKELKTLPILNRSQYKGGMKVETVNKRHYPYGKLGRRTIGFVRNATEGVTNNYVGLEGKFDYALRGSEGKFWTKKSDFGNVQSFDSVAVRAVDGMDIRTTLNIDYQSIADKALREGIAEDPDVEGGCVILMEVRTGAIRAMVNLMRDPKREGAMEEISNLAIGRAGEPGSVFKTTNLMIMFESGKLRSLNDRIPTNGGVLSGYRYSPDRHILDYERAHNAREIPIYEGFKVSSNYMFQYLAVTNYGRNPQKYIDRIYSYKLGEAFDFDLEGLVTPRIRTPKDEGWSKYDLTSIATGYAVNETPLHIITFYNAIAGKGRMMKPYLVEDIEKDGIVETRRGPSVLNSSICSKATADTLTRALSYVVEEGTATRLRGARCSVAGKTGTSRVALPEGGYEKDGKKKNQGTFVGFFPTEDPQYSIICVIYSYLSSRDFYGGTIPAATVRKIIDRIYDIDPYWQPELAKGGEIPHMK